MQKRPTAAVRSIPDAAIRAYADVWRAAGAMRTLALYAVLIILAALVVEEFIPPRLINSFAIGTLLDFAIDCVRNFCLTPIIIAIHRFIILDDVTPGYVLDPAEPGFMPFFGWLVALSLLTTLVFSVPELAMALGGSVLLATGIEVVALAAVLIVVMRLTILFPAIAVGAGNANAKAALADTKGHAWKIFAIFLLVLLPVAVVSLAVSWLLGPGIRNTGSPLAVANLIVIAVMQTAVTFLCAAIASRIFEKYADHVSLGSADAAKMV